LVVDSSHIVAGAVLTQEDEGLQGGKIGASWFISRQSRMIVSLGLEWDHYLKVLQVTIKQSQMFTWYPLKLWVYCCGLQFGLCEKESASVKYLNQEQEGLDEGAEQGEWLAKMLLDEHIWGEICKKKS
jgi:hypothetical protein